MQKTAWLVIVIVVVVLGWQWFTQKPETVISETIKIGAALGLTGICVEFGEGELRAATLAVEEINAAGGVNGKKLKLISEDTLCDNKTTVSAFQKLINIDKVVAIVGPTWGDSFQGGYPLLREKQIVSVSPSAAIEALEFNRQPLNFIFSTWFPQRKEVTALQEYARSRRLTKFVIVHDTDPFGAMMASLFKEEAEKQKISIVEEHEVAVDTQDFKTIIARIKAKKPEALFVSFLGSDSKAVFLKQARELGITQDTFSSADIQNPVLLSSFASVLEGVIYTYPKGTESFDAFAKKYEIKYGVEPQGPSASNAYDAVNILAAAMKKGGTNGAELERALLEISIPGVTFDTLKFSDKHQVAGGEFEIKTIKDGAFVTAQ